MAEEPASGFSVFSECGSEMAQFHIDVTECFWIGGSLDDREDLCLHGNALAVIGDRRLEYADATVSAAALYLLKSLTEDHVIGQDNQMLPCCGFCLIPNDAGTEVSVSGCPNGVDWTVRHEDGYEALVDPAEYRRAVFAFADKIETFYKTSSAKILPRDDWERRGCLTFWNEWHRRRSG